MIPVLQGRGLRVGKRLLVRMSVKISIRYHVCTGCLLGPYDKQVETGNDSGLGFR